MEGSALGLIELLLVLGSVLGFGIWQLVSVRRSQRRDAERAAAAAAAQARAPASGRDEGHPSG